MTFNVFGTSESSLINYADKTDANSDIANLSDGDIVFAELENSVGIVSGDIIRWDVEIRSFESKVNAATFASTADAGILVEVSGAYNITNGSGLETWTDVTEESHDDLDLVGTYANKAAAEAAVGGLTEDKIVYATSEDVAGIVHSGAIQWSGGFFINSVATYSAGITAARAGGSDGDWYQTTNTGKLYRRLTVDNVAFLIPAHLYGSTSNVTEGGSSRCMFTLADSQAQVEARGWAFEVSGGTATATKTENNPVSLAAPLAGSTHGRVAYVPTSGFGNLLVLIKINTMSKSGGTPASGYAGIRVNDGSKVIKIGFMDSTVGKWQFTTTSNNYTSGDADSIDNVTMGTSGWFVGHLNLASGKVCYYESLDDSALQVAIPYTDTTTDVTTDQIYVECQKDSSGTTSCALSVDEFLALSY